MNDTESFYDVKVKKNGKEVRDASVTFTENRKDAIETFLFLEEKEDWLTNEEIGDVVTIEFTTKDIA